LLHVLILKKDSKSHRGINIDHEINVDQHSKSRNKCKYSIQYLHLFRSIECWSTLIPPIWKITEKSHWFSLYCLHHRSYIYIYKYIYIYLSNGWYTYIGIQIAAVACFDTKKGSQIFEKLAESEKSRTSLFSGSDWNHSHPPSDERHIKMLLGIVVIFICTYAFLVVWMIIFTDPLLSFV
jgi:hypothetical protein